MAASKVLAAVMTWMTYLFNCDLKYANTSAFNEPAGGSGAAAPEAAAAAATAGVPASAREEKGAIEGSALPSRSFGVFCLLWAPRRRPAVRAAAAARSVRMDFLLSGGVTAVRTTDDGNRG